MENQEQNNSMDNMWRKAEKSHRRGKVIGGVLVVSAGVLFLMRELGVEIPHWLFSWKIFLMAMGIVVLVKHNFLHPMGYILMAIGGAFIIGDAYPELNIKHFVWPVFIILIGIAMIFKPFRKRKHMCDDKFRGHFGRHHRTGGWGMGAEQSKEDFVDATSIFGGVKKNILSKNFKGGDISNVFGGSEINLTQADFEGTATIDLVNIFGGTKLIIPAHWEINSDVAAIFGGVEDKRPIIQGGTVGAKKVLNLTGTSFFGGIEIKSY